MLYGFFKVFLYFFICSIIGYVVEITNVSLKSKKVILSRGFLIGPYLPIYGIGSMVMTFLFKKYETDVVVLFVMGMVVCSLIEYITSYVLEKIFNVRWWDYSNYKYNVDGRICLENGFLFGLAGVLVIKLLNPFLLAIYHSFSKSTIYILGTIFSVIFFTDLIESLFIMSKLKINSHKYNSKDATKEVRSEIINELYKHNTLTARLLKAFPNVSMNHKNQYGDFNNLVFKIKDEIKKIKKQDKLKFLKKELKNERKKIKSYKKKCKSKK